MKPSIGRIVHYVGSSARHHAAVITAIWPAGVRPAVEKETVDLEIFGNVAVRFHSCVGEDSGSTPEAHTWHWPERVE